MNDVEKIESVISSFYRALSGRADAPRDWGKFLALFVPGAAVVPSSVANAPDGPVKAICVSEYAERLRIVLTRSDFYETAAVKRAEVFGNIAQAVCVYEARQSPVDAEPFRQGVHYVQLVRMGEDWRITGMIWLDASDTRPLPQEYQR